MNEPSEDQQAREDHHEELMATLKRRGYIQPAYEIYGGVAGLYDYGPLGQGLKRRFEELWRQAYVVEEGYGEISTPTVAPEPVFKASGHVDQFADTVIECPDCRAAARADHYLIEQFDGIVAELAEAIDEVQATVADAEREQALLQARDHVLEQVKNNRASIEHVADTETVSRLLCLPDAPEEALVPVERTFGPYTVHYLASSFKIEDEDGEIVAGHEIRCRSCGSTLHGRAHIEPFNLMFSTRIGPGGGQQGYLRPETAQGMFVNFDWLYRYNREQVPFGVVQIGRAYRNEIAPRQKLIRLREFWQAEAEVFVDPDDKSHPRFDEVAGTRTRLVPDGQDPVEMTIGDAVAKGIIKNEMVGYFVARTQAILIDAGLDREHVRFRQHESDEMAHYASDCWDAEFHSSRYGWVECVGIADRGCYDLEAHEAHAGTDLTAFRPYDEPVEEEIVRLVPDMAKLGPRFKGQAGAVADAVRALDAAEVDPAQPVEVEVDGETVEVPAEAFEVEETTERIAGERFSPHVIEPSYGIDRILYAVLEHSFDPTGERDVLRLPITMAPIQVGVLPLVSKDGLPENAQALQTELQRLGLVTYYDDGGSIGRRYARLDEVGTPLAVTVDHDTLEEDTVTVRERDSQEQVRVPIDGLAGKLREVLEGRRRFEEL